MLKELNLYKYSILQYLQEVHDIKPPSGKQLYNKLVIMYKPINNLMFHKIPIHPKHERKVN